MSKPLIGATLVGLIWRYSTGLAVGAATELASMGLVSVGRSRTAWRFLAVAAVSAFACLLQES